MKRWILLLLFALVFAGAAAYLSLYSKAILDVPPLLPDYEPGQVSELQLYGPGGEEVLLRRTGELWGVESEDGYPADEERLYDLLLSLSDLRLEERKTAREENHSLLGLVAPGQEGANAMRLVLKEESGVIADFLLGNEATSREGAYLRLTGDPQSWLVTPGLEKPPLDPWLWLRQPLLTVEDNELQELRFTVEEKEYRLQNLNGKLQPAPDSGFVLIEGKSLPEYQLSLEDLRFEEVWPRESEDLPAGEYSYQATVLCCEGLQIAMEFTELQEGALLRLSATGEGAAAERAESFNRLHAPWAYQVESGAAEIFDFAPGDYLEPRSEEAEAEDKAEDKAEGEDKAEAQSEDRSDSGIEPLKVELNP